MRHPVGARWIFALSLAAACGGELETELLPSDAGGGRPSTSSRSATTGASAVRATSATPITPGTSPPATLSSGQPSTVARDAAPGTISSPCPRPYDAGPPSVDDGVTAVGPYYSGPWPGFDAGLTNAAAAPQTLYEAAGAARVNGAIATDGDLVFWIQSPELHAEVAVCPVTGCPGNQPAVFAAGVSFNGELIAAKGRLYFEAFDTSILDCPLSGCGSAPSSFAGLRESSSTILTLSADDSDLYWVDNDGDNNGIYTCPLGDTCASPRLITTVPNSSYIGTNPYFGVAAPDLFWVDKVGNTYELDAAPTAGGAARTVCTLPIWSTGPVSVVGGYAYVPTNGSYYGDPGIYRCPVAGGTATLFDAELAADLQSDGTSLFWIVELENAAGGWAYVARCTPGETCRDRSVVGGLFAEPGEGQGFTPFGGSVYASGANIVRTAYCPR